MSEGILLSLLYTVPRFSVFDTSLTLCVVLDLFRIHIFLLELDLRSVFVKSTVRIRPQDHVCCVGIPSCKYHTKMFGNFATCLTVTNRFLSHNVASLLVVGKTSILLV